MNEQKKHGGPSPLTVKAARAWAGLTQKAAGELVHSSMRTWQDWESGARNMPPGKFELFCIKTGQTPIA